MSKELNDKLNNELAREMTLHKKSKTFEQIFQETLDITTPTQPGDLRSTRKWDEKPKEELDEWL
jgi:hypothetical protein